MSAYHWERIVVRVADAADGGHQIGFGQALGVVHGQVLGEFKRSSQHLNEGGCDGHSKAKITPVWTSTIAVAGTAVSRGAI